MHVKNGRAPVIDVRQIVVNNYVRAPPLGVVVYTKFSIIHDHTFSPRQLPHPSVLANTDFLQAPSRDTRGVLNEILMRPMFFPQTFGPSARIVTSKLDVKPGVSPGVTGPGPRRLFGCVFGDVAVVDPCLESAGAAIPNFGASWRRLWTRRRISAVVQFILSR